MLSLLCLKEAQFWHSEALTVVGTKEGVSLSV